MGYVEGALLPMSVLPTRSVVVDQIFEAFGRRGHELHGEDATELEHALQIAVLADGDDAT